MAISADITAAPAIISGQGLRRFFGGGATGLRFGLLIGLLQS
jgi:hypothetical protein